MNDFDYKMVMIYTFIGVIITVTNVLILLKDKIKLLLHSQVKQILGMVALLILIVPLGLFGYWVMYSYAYIIAQYLFKHDIIMMHLFANTPSYIMLYYIYAGTR